MKDLEEVFEGTKKDDTGTKNHKRKCHCKIPPKETEPYQTCNQKYLTYPKMMQQTVTKTTKYND